MLSTVRKRFSSASLCTLSGAHVRQAAEVPGRWGPGMEPQSSDTQGHSFPVLQGARLATAFCFSS